ncbi:acetyl-coenzyme A synthetase 2-like, mitochondrial isoform X2 [Artemia franciscana]
MQDGIFRWFEGGILNVSVQCLDRHAKRNPDKVAIIWEKDEPGQEERVTYQELLELVCRFSNLLKAEGVEKGDRVAIYMPVTPLAAAAILACARIGAIHSVVFAGFSAEALANRINDAQATVVVTADQSIRGGKTINLKKTVDVALIKCPQVKRVLVQKRTGTKIDMTPERDLFIEESLIHQSVEYYPEPMESEDPLFMLYTSGSTGKPKGVVHTQAGYILYAMIANRMVFDLHPNDIYCCVADIGWITGHSSVIYGPLANGVTTVLFESIPTYPNPGRYWESIERLCINHFFCAPTAIRVLLQHPDTWVTKYDRSSLRTIGSAGEPINIEAWNWCYNVAGNKKCHIIDNWWQTETGGAIISPRPASENAEIVPGMAMRPFYGIDLELVDTKGDQLAGKGVEGILCIKKPWPGMARTVFGDHERYVNTYFKMFPGLYYTGDGAIRDSKGYFKITGRMDDVINVSGHRLSTAEVEDAICEHPIIAETAVVGYPHEVKGEGIYSFVVLKENANFEADLVASELKSIVRKKLTGYAAPDIVQICPALPKTRSGKILRRILRKVATGEYENLGDISTLADPSVVEAIVKGPRKPLLPQSTRVGNVVDLQIRMEPIERIQVPQTSCSGEVQLRERNKKQTRLLALCSIF